MAYLSERDQLDGLFSFLAPLAATSAAKAGAAVMTKQEVLPPLKTMTPAAPTPQSIGQTAATLTQNVLHAFTDAFAALRQGSQPLATSIGTGLATNTPAPNPTAMRTAGPPSGEAPRSPPVNVMTGGSDVNNLPALIPNARPAMPAWVIPAAIIGGGAILYFTVLRRR